MNSRQLFLSIVAAHNAGIEGAAFANMPAVFEDEIETYFSISDSPRRVARRDLPAAMRAQLEGRLLIEDPRPCGNIVAANVRPHSRPTQVEGILWMDFGDGRLSRLGFLAPDVRSHRASA